MVQVWKKVMLCLIACLFVAGVTLVLMTTSPENAYAEEERPYICVNGERKESVALLQGQSATVEIKKGNGSYETILYRTDDKGGFSLEGNQIFVKENSRVGTFVVHASCWLNDAETFDREISVVITAKGGTEPVFITEEEEEERRMIVELPQDVEYVDATVAMQDNPTGDLHRFERRFIRHRGQGYTGEIKGAWSFQCECYRILRRNHTECCQGFPAPAGHFSDGYCGTCYPQGSWHICRSGPCCDRGKREPAGTYNLC